MLHCRPSELEDESAVTLDWLLALQAAHARVQAKQIEEPSNR
jgi:hypothetical protein